MSILVNNGAGGSIPEPPSNDKLYARKAGDWVKATISVTQSEYNTLVANNEDDPDTPYFITDAQGGDDISSNGQVVYSEATGSNGQTRIISMPWVNTIDDILNLSIKVLSSYDISRGNTISITVKGKNDITIASAHIDVPNPRGTGVTNTAGQYAYLIRIGQTYSFMFKSANNAILDIDFPIFSDSSYLSNNTVDVYASRKEAYRSSVGYITDLNNTLYRTPGYWAWGYCTPANAANLVNFPSGNWTSNIAGQGFNLTVDVISTSATVVQTLMKWTGEVWKRFIVNSVIGDWELEYPSTVTKTLEEYQELVDNDEDISNIPYFVTGAPSQIIRPASLIEDDIERMVGWKMVDSVNRLYKPMYKKKYIGNTPSVEGGVVSVPFINGAENNRYENGFTYDSNSSILPLPLTSRSTVTNQVILWITVDVSFSIAAGSTATAYLNKSFEVWFSYTKTTDTAIPISYIKTGGMAGGDMSMADYDQGGVVKNAGGIPSYNTVENVPITYNSGFSAVSGYDGIKYYPALRLCVFNNIFQGTYPTNAWTEIGKITNSKHWPITSTHTAAVGDSNTPGQFIIYTSGAISFLPYTLVANQCRASAVYFTRGV